MDEKTYSVSEAVRLIGVESHVLRYWEEELNLEIRRTSQGHRVYDQKNIDTFCQVKRLKETGIQLKAIRVLLSEEEQSSMSGEIFRRMLGDKHEKSETVAESTAEDRYEVITIQEESNLYRFEQMMQKIVREVVAEQNGLLEEAIMEFTRNEMEELCERYEEIFREAAADMTVCRRKTIFERITGLWKR